VQAGTRPDAIWRRLRSGVLEEAFPNVYRLPGAPRTLAVLDLMDRKHPKEPHWYLFLVGSDGVRIFIARQYLFDARPRDAARNTHEFV